MTKLRILVLGGTGFIGRNVVTFFVQNALVDKVVVVDKVPPQLSWMNDEVKAVFENDVVEFRSANLIHAASVERAFAGLTIDFVINCAAETRPGMAPEIYEESIFKLGVNCVENAAKLGGLKRFIQLSSCMSSNSGTEVTEECAMEPWTVIGKQHAKLEEYLRSQKNVKYAILRLPIVYGKGDRTGLTPRIIAACLYKHLNATMKLLWTKDIKLNTIHVQDVASAIHHLLQNSSDDQIFNLVDDAKSTQGSITDILCSIYGIKCEYMGQILSKMTQIDVAGVVKDINEEHLGTWARLCQKGDLNTPLTPYIDADALENKHVNMSNRKLLATGYELKHPIVTRELIQDVIDDFVIQKFLPNEL
ncbi:dTDP-D-glucose 4,6-dehydratase [Culicoides brevitarsis]|uniref:dTDP-D-glucose 4,6-dehydratase n=1 Tax=Culicoides brevitarsis TaxID=469753 RepID=UPI00307B9955